MIIKNRKQFTPFASPSWSLIVKPESNLNRDTRFFFERTVDTTRLPRQKSPHTNLRLQHKRAYELALTATFVLLITAFQISRRFSFSAPTLNKAEITIEVADIPVTRQFRKPPPPVRPSLPIPTEEESVPEDVTIASTEIDLSDLPPPPPFSEEDDEVPIFVVYDEPPRIIGGIAELRKHLKYPSLAAKAKIEGIVFVKVTVGVDGSTEQMEIIRSKPANLGFEEAALEALHKIKWMPAKQRDKRIRVWVTIPVQFKLLDS